MSKANLRIGIIILTIATALIHISLIQIPMILNGVGYLALLVAFFWPPQFLKVPKKTVYNVYLFYVAITFVLYFVRWGAESFDSTLGIATKVIEALLFIALWMHKSDS